MRKSLDQTTKEHVQETWLVCLTYKNENNNEFGGVRFDHYPTKGEIDGAVKALMDTHPSPSPKVWQIRKETVKTIRTTDIYTEWEEVNG